MAIGWGVGGAGSLVLLLAVPAWGQHAPMPSAAESVGSSRQAPRAFVADQAVIPDYWHIAAEVARVTGPDLADETPFRLGDYTRLSLDGRLALHPSPADRPGDPGLGERFELAAGVSLPPKRSEVTQVPTIVGGFLRGRLALGPGRPSTRRPSPSGCCRCWSRATTGPGAFTRAVRRPQRLQPGGGAA